MKTIIFSVGVGLVLTGVVNGADTPPGLEKKNGVPPGLQKKGGVPPGQAKKHEQTNQVAASPAPVAPVAATPTPVTPTPVTPAAPAPPSAPASPAPAPNRTVAAAPTPAVPPTPPAATPQPTTTKPITHREAKERLDRELQIIPERIEENHLDTPALKQISRITGVPVERLLEQRKEYDAGYPGLLLGNLIAQQTKATFKQLITERKRTNAPWSVIAHQRHVELQPLLESVLDLKRHLNQVQQQRRAAR